jgi:hypothetical protein
MPTKREVQRQSEIAVGPLATATSSTYIYRLGHQEIDSGYARHLLGRGSGVLCTDQYPFDNREPMPAGLWQCPKLGSAMGCLHKGIHNVHKIQ